MSDATTPKLCVNCKHILTPRHAADPHRCAHKAHGVDLVTGEAITPECRDQRSYDSRRCTSIGLLFEPCDPIPSQPLQPGAVSRPVGITIGRHTAIVVQEYALGVGVSIPGDGYDLGRTERAFELESPRGRIVFDPGRTRLAQWLVPTVQGDVAPVGQALQAIDQEQAAEIRSGDAVDVHGDPSPSFGVGRTAILSLPAGWGKSTFGAELARQLGCTSIVDEWTFPFDITPGALHLTNANRFGKKGGVA